MERLIQLKQDTAEKHLHRLQGGGMAMVPSLSSFVSLSSLPLFFYFILCRPGRGDSLTYRLSCCILVNNLPFMSSYRTYNDRGVCRPVPSTVPVTPPVTTPITTVSTTQVSSQKDEIKLNGTQKPTTTVVFHSQGTKPEDDPQALQRGMLQVVDRSVNTSCPESTSHRQLSRGT